MTTYTPPQYYPMLAHTAPAPFDNPEWCFQPKYDGIRCIAYFNGAGQVRLVNRAGNDITARFPDIAESPEEIVPDGDPCVLDGELVCFKPDPDNPPLETIPDFQAMQTRMNRKLNIAALTIEHPAYFYVFDILEHDGTKMYGQPLAKRQELLARIVSPSWTTPTYVEHGTTVADIYRTWEGTVAKRLDSLYTPGIRSRNWLKIKNKQHATVHVLGYTPGYGRRETTFGALVVGEPIIGDAAYGTACFRVIGEVGTGFNDEDLRTMKHLLGEAESRRDLISDTMPEGWRKEYIPVLPTMLVHIEYLERTSHGQVRHAVYKGRRP